MVSKTEMVQKKNAMSKLAVNLPDFATLCGVLFFGKTSVGNSLGSYFEIFFSLRYLKRPPSLPGVFISPRRNEINCRLAARHWQEASAFVACKPGYRVAAGRSFHLAVCF